MSQSDRSSLQLRAQEIINASPQGMTTREALKQALAERFRNDPAGLLEWAASTGQSALKGLRKRTYELPEEEQGALFVLPAIIGINTPDGDLLIPRESADLGQVRQWAREGKQHHSTQKLRFDRFLTQLDVLKDEPDQLPWWSARAMLCADPESDE